MQIFDVLEYQGLSRGGVVNEARIRRLSLRKIVDLAQAIASEMQADLDAGPGTRYSFASSLGLGGSRVECTFITCRQRKLHSLARFAALYGDVVWINNFLSSYTPDIVTSDRVSVDGIRRGFADDLQLLLEIMPVLDAGLIRLYNPPGHVCNDCLAEAAYGPEAPSRLKRIRSEYIKIFESRCKCSIEIDEEIRPTMVIDGLSELVDHGPIIRELLELPKYVTENPRLV